MMAPRQAFEQGPVEDELLNSSKCSTSRTQFDSTDTMTIGGESWEAFISPWKFENKYGIPEIPMEDVEDLSDIGHGKKGSTKIAMWNDKKIALKTWRDTYSEPYSEWEILMYCRLKPLQGTLIPKLHFVSRTADGKRALGLELGQPMTYCQKESMHNVIKSIAEYGWKQRCASIRPDNFVYMEGDNKDEKRLVAIDLESFVPDFHTKKNDSCVVVAHDSVLGVPVEEPLNVEVPGNDQDLEWTANGWRHTPAIWSKWRSKKEVTLFAYNHNYSSDTNALKTILERSFLLKKAQGTLVATPLFLTRERNGTILLGYERACEDYYLHSFSDDEEPEVEKLCKNLSHKFGFSISDKDKANRRNFLKRAKDKRILFRDLSLLHQERDPPDIEHISSDESSEGRNLSTSTSLPFELKSTFQIERKHGFNKQTIGLFVSDKIKSLVLAFLIGSPFIALLLYIIKNSGAINDASELFNHVTTAVTKL